MAGRKYYAYTTDKYSTNLVEYDLLEIETGQPEIDEPLICNETKYPLLHRCYQCTSRFLRDGDYCVYCGVPLTNAAVYGALIAFFARLQFPVLMPTEASNAGYTIDTAYLEVLFPLLKSLDVPALKTRLAELGLDDLLADITAVENDPAVLQLLATSNDLAAIEAAIKDLIEA